MGAVLAAKDATGKLRVVLVNRDADARTARIDLPTGTATPARVQTLADPAQQPADTTPSAVIDAPAHSIVLVELS